MKHSRGPWYVVGGEVFNYTRKVGICVPYGLDRNNDANMQAISALPELLEAAKGLLDAGDFLTLIPKEGRSTLSCIRFREELEAAIKKAEGES